MKREYEEAFTEVEEIFKIMPIEILSKIPLKFRNIISEKKAEDYKITIKEPLDEQKLKYETIVILGLIYRDFLSSPEEREQLQLKDAEELKKIEEDLKEQYDVNKMFEKKKSNFNKTYDEENYEEQLDLTLYKEPNFLKKFFNLIKGIFKKNKY